MDYIFLIVGLGLLLLAANYLVDSSVAIAQRAKISNFIISSEMQSMAYILRIMFIKLYCFIPLSRFLNEFRETYHNCY